MSAVNYKVGDKVKVLNNTVGLGQGSPDYCVGEIGTVTSIDQRIAEYRVEFEEPTNDYWFYEDANLGPMVKEVFYVIDEADSEVLSEHTNQDAAEADAKACAEQTDAHDGIGVYKRIVVYKTKSELVEEWA